jgi:hypothetical protein
LRGLTALEAMKADTALRLTAYSVTNASSLQPALSALATAVSLEEASRLSRTVIQAVERQHQALFSQELVRAGTEAARKAGFGSVEIRRSGELIRVIGTNEAGQALVAEVDVAPASEPQMVTEVVGSSDSSVCEPILNRFDEALEAEGVRGDSPGHKPTGGVCELSFSREILDRLRGPVTPKKPIAAKQDGDRQKGRRRRRALNRERTRS